jgi:hypothetical protein
MISGIVNFLSVKAIKSWKGMTLATAYAPVGDLILPFFALLIMLSAARYASAEIVHVGWFRALVTKLLPSTT